MTIAISSYREPMLWAAGLIFLFAIGAIADALSGDDGVMTDAAKWTVVVGLFFILLAVAIAAVALFAIK